MDDCISRQAAIDALRLIPYDLGKRELEDAIKAVEQLPSAQPERKKGKWVEEDDAIIHGHCSNCGWISIWQETDVFGMNYCPNCGADMRGDQT